MNPGVSSPAVGIIHGIGKAGKISNPQSQTNPGCGGQNCQRGRKTRGSIKSTRTRGSCPASNGHDPVPPSGKPRHKRKGQSLGAKNQTQIGPKKRFTPTNGLQPVGIVMIQNRANSKSHGIGQPPRPSKPAADSRGRFCSNRLAALRNSGVCSACRVGPRFDSGDQEQHPKHRGGGGGEEGPKTQVRQAQNHQ